VAQRRRGTSGAAAAELGEVVGARAGRNDAGGARGRRRGRGRRVVASGRAVNGRRGNERGEEPLRGAQAERRRRRKHRVLSHEP
jgi:hypothetical protein